jgi:hypothetical protein
MIISDYTAHTTDMMIWQYLYLSSMCVLVNGLYLRHITLKGQMAPELGVFTNSKKIDYYLQILTKILLLLNLRMPTSLESRLERICASCGNTEDGVLRRVAIFEDSDTVEFTLLNISLCSECYVWPRFNKIVASDWTDAIDTIVANSPASE